MLFIVGLPVVQIILFCFAIGHDPKGLQIAVSNHELTADMAENQYCPIEFGCNQTYLSCRYLNMLKNNKSVVIVSILYSIRQSAYVHSMSLHKGWT